MIQKTFCLSPALLRMNSFRLAGPRITTHMDESPNVAAKAVKLPTHPKYVREPNQVQKSCLLFDPQLTTCMSEPSQDQRTTQLIVYHTGGANNTCDP